MVRGLIWIWYRTVTQLTSVLLLYIWNARCLYFKSQLLRIYDTSIWRKNSKLCIGASE